MDGCSGQEGQEAERLPDQGLSSHCFGSKSAASIRLRMLRTVAVSRNEGSQLNQGLINRNFAGHALEAVGVT
jgi:hypothetical protein